MWEPTIGPMELVLLLAAACAMLLLGASGRRWLVGVVPCLVIGAAVTPADPVSMLLVALPLAAAFAVGVYSSRFIRPSGSA